MLDSQGAQFMNHPLYSLWKEMRTRCSNPKRKDYRHYGGRGIRVCERWNSFEVFIQDMGPRPTPKHEIDRIDSAGGYCPENCKWSTRMEQMQNTGRSHRIEYNGKILTISAWARELGIRREIIKDRLRRGWAPERALSLARQIVWSRHPVRGN